MEAFVQKCKLPVCQVVSEMRPTVELPLLPVYSWCPTEALTFHLAMPFHHSRQWDKNPLDSKDSSYCRIYGSYTSPSSPRRTQDLENRIALLHNCSPTMLAVHNRSNYAQACNKFINLHVYVYNTYNAWTHLKRQANTLASCESEASWGVATADRWQYSSNCLGVHLIRWYMLEADRWLGCLQKKVNDIN